MRIVAFHQLAFEQYNEWATTDKKMFERVRRLIAEPPRYRSPESGNPNHSRRTSRDIGPVALQTNIG